GPRGTNLLDGGFHFYNVYETADGGYVSLAAHEPQFYANLCALVAPLGIDLDPAGQMDATRWPEHTATLAGLFRTRTRDEWVAFFAGHEVCFAPVLPMREAREHPHNVARGAFTEIDGIAQPVPAPRFSRTATAVQGAPVAAGADTETALAEWGLAPAAVAALLASGAISGPA
ncbi:MAG: CoA transferase, partial [Actinomycetota bacterium]